MSIADIAKRYAAEALQDGTVEGVKRFLDRKMTEGRSGSPAKASEIDAGLHLFSSATTHVIENERSIDIKKICNEIDRRYNMLKEGWELSMPSRRYIKSFQSEYELLECIEIMEQIGLPPVRRPINKGNRKLVMSESTYQTFQLMLENRFSEISSCPTP